MSKFFYSLIASLVCSPVAWAGPSTSSMAQSDLAAPRVETAAPAIAVAVDAPSDRSSDRLEYRAASVGDASDIGPADPHPMIPLPPAVWAGFAGLAYIVRRVTSRRA